MVAGEGDSPSITTAARGGGGRMGEDERRCGPEVRRALEGQGGTGPREEGHGREYSSLGIRVPSTNMNVFSVRVLFGFKHLCWIRVHFRIRLPFRIRVTAVDVEHS